MRQLSLWKDFIHEYIASLEGFHIRVYCFFGRISHVNILSLWKDCTYDYIIIWGGFIGRKSLFGVSLYCSTAVQSL